MLNYTTLNFIKQYFMTLHTAALQYTTLQNTALCSVTSWSKDYQCTHWNLSTGACGTDLRSYHVHHRKPHFSNIYSVQFVITVLSKGTSDFVWSMLCLDPEGPVWTLVLDPIGTATKGVTLRLSKATELAVSKSSRVKV